MDFSTLTLEINKKLATGTIWLNRPEVRNAFNETMILEIIQAFHHLNDHQDVMLIRLRGKGPSFCAGADLNWMGDVLNYTKEENFNESLNLSKCFYEVYTSEKPTIATVHGASIGGANGLLAACDFAIAEDNTIFSLSEVKIGVIPACISPYILKRVGEFSARELMLTGKRFNGKEAESYRLVNKSMHEDQMEAYVEEIADALRTSGPNAMKQCKDLLNHVSNTWSLLEAYTKTAEMIAETRMSEEAQEGMKAFLEKRKPVWAVNDNNEGQ